MKRLLIVLAVLLAFVGGFLAGRSRLQKRYAMDEFKAEVRQKRDAAAVSSQALGKLEAGDVEGAKLVLAPRIASYYETYRFFSDPSPFQQKLVEDIERVISQSAVLRAAIEEEKSSGRPVVTKTLLPRKSSQSPGSPQPTP